MCVYMRIADVEMGIFWEKFCRGNIDYSKENLKTHTGTPPSPPQPSPPSPSPLPSYIPLPLEVGLLKSSQGAWGAL